MEKENKMYSFEILDKAISAVAKGLIFNDSIFKESVKELPKEVQNIVLASVIAGRVALNVQLTNILFKASEIEKMREKRNSVEESVKKMDKEK